MARPTVGELIEHAAAAMTEASVVFGHGSDSAWDEATQLVLAVTGIADDRANLGLPVADMDAACIERLLERRIRERTPMAYLIGRSWFAGLEFLIEPGVVIPRSPIGELIGCGFEPWLVREPANILDLCTGSGCIGIAAALAFPEARLTLVDVDPAATGLAVRNVRLHGLEARAQVLSGDLYKPLPVGQRYDLILSNPPYVDHRDLATLPREYRHEPALGLDGGADGLDVVRRILDGAPDRLSPTGVLVCEVGMSAPAVRRSYPSLRLVWPELGAGGTGTVFILLPA